MNDILVFILAVAVFSGFIVGATAKNRMPIIDCILVGVVFGGIILASGLLTLAIGHVIFGIAEVFGTRVTVSPL